MSAKKSSLIPAMSRGVSFSALRQQFAKKSGNDLVTVQDWQVSYGSNGLVESCTVTAKEIGDSITSVGLLVYSVDGKTLYCSQFTANTGSNSVSPAVSTEGFNFQAGGQVRGVVFGYIEGVEYFFEQDLTITGSSSSVSAEKVEVKTPPTSPRRPRKKPSAKKRGKKP